MSKMTLIASAAGVAVALYAGAALAETVMAPGYYETVTRFAGDPDPQVTRDCVTAEEARARTVERELAKAMQGQCAYSQRQIGAGRFAIAASCNDDGVKSTFKNTGVYSSTGFTMNLTSTTVVGGQSASLNLTSTSRRLAAACPAGTR